METLNTPPMGNLLSSRAGMGLPVPLPISVPTTQPRLRPPLRLPQMAWHDEQLSQQFAPPFSQQPRLSGVPGMYDLPHTGQPIAVPPPVDPARSTVGRSAESIATHTAGARESMARSKIARFVVDNQESIAAKCKHGFGRLPRVATVDLPVVPDTKAARTKKEKTRGLRQSSPLSVSSSASSNSSGRSSVSHTQWASPRKVTKRQHTRASSSSSVSASSLDAITSYIASMPESEKLPHAHSGVPGRPKARHVSFSVNEYGTQCFTIRGHGTEQSYEICGDAMIFHAVEATMSLHGSNDKGWWESLIYGLGPRTNTSTRVKRASAGKPDASTRPTLPSLIEVAALQAGSSSQRASLDLPPIRNASATTHSTSVLATMQPSPARLLSSSLSEEDAEIEEHIRALEAAIHAGGAKRRVVEGAAASPWKTVVLIPPETAATVGSLLGVILREQYCKQREASETQQAQAAAAQGVSLPSIAELFGPRHLSSGHHAPPFRQ